MTDLPDIPELPETAQEIDPDKINSQLEHDQYIKALAAIRDRCLKAGIEYQEENEEPIGQAISINLPAGRSKRSIFVYQLEDAEHLLKQPFEKYVFISGYDAVCSYEEDFIEASINVGSAGLFRRRVFDIAAGQDYDPEALVLDVTSTNPELSIQLYLVSRRLPLASTNPKPSFVIKGISVRTHDRAAEILETLANSLFFEIDMRFNIPLGLARPRSSVPRPFAKPDQMSRKPLQFPSSMYDKQAASLYWYGRTAINMPLLRFLALYQTIEFYFPVYAQQDAIRYVRGILKDPRFGIYDDKDIIRLIAALQTGRSSAFGDERSQLRATVQSCLDAEGVRSFLTSDQQLKSFYTTPAEWKTISDVQIPINRADADLRSDVADRLYDIRCKVVHTKSDSPSGSPELLLPFSKEADLLGFDIELAQYVARRVLIASSSKLAL